MFTNPRILLSAFFLLIYSHCSIAEEGMWVPFLLKGAVESDMKAKGLMLDAEDIYDLNKSSLKDGVVHFGGGCTGEMISEKGLLLTNHHCGYSQIQSHSSLENDLLSKGFWAENFKEELPNPGLTASFIIRIEDVTNSVFEGVKENMSLLEKESIISKNSKKIEREAVNGTHYSSYIKPMYYGNAYYLYVVETFKDVRLVGTPPSSIGKFGYDTDNWMWPRHTADFALFRIYAGPDNKPASFSPDNTPYVPRHVFPINMKGAKENDFTMVYGFPGTTKEYLTSDGISLVVNVSDPAKIRLREARLNVIDRNMSKNDTIRIAYASKQSTISNAYKKWQGEIRGLRKMNAIQIKTLREQDFETWVNADPARIEKYGDLMTGFSESYSLVSDLQVASDHYGEAILGIELLFFARSFSSLVDKSKSTDTNPDSLQQEKEKLIRSAQGFYKNYSLATDKEISRSLISLYASNVLPQYQSPYFKLELKKYKGSTDRLSDDLFTKSMFRDQHILVSFLNSFKAPDHKKLSNDPLYKLISEASSFHKNEVSAPLKRINSGIDSLYTRYMKALMEKEPGKLFYPDANSTLRVSYGKVEGYEPFDGAYYKYYTTIDGLMAKKDLLTADYIIPDKLRDLWLEKDYGPYATNGELRVCFIASNHTTGGYSGSPVLNAKGELIGINFDRNWEGTMSDLMYDVTMARNIILDIRYALFIIDKFAGADHLIKEMNLIH